MCSRRRRRRSDTLQLQHTTSHYIYIIFKYIVYIYTGNMVCEIITDCRLKLRRQILYYTDIRCCRPSKKDTQLVLYSGIYIILYIHLHATTVRNDLLLQGISDRYSTKLYNHSIAVCAPPPCTHTTVVFECSRDDRRCDDATTYIRPIESSDWHISLCHTYCATMMCTYIYMQFNASVRKRNRISRVYCCVL